MAGEKQQLKSRLHVSFAKVHQWIKEKTGNSYCNSEEPKARNERKKRRRRRKSLPDDELKLLNNLSGIPHLATIFEAYPFMRKTGKRKKMNGCEMESLEIGMHPQTIGDGKATGKQEESRSSESILQLHGGKKEMMDNGNGNNKEQGSGKRNKYKKNRIRDDELKILNDLTGYPHLVTMFQGEKLFREKGLIRQKINIPETNSAGGSQSQATLRVDSSREDCTEGDCGVLQTHSNVLTLEVVGFPSTSLRQDEALGLCDLRALISPSFDAFTDDIKAWQQEKSSPDKCVGATADVTLLSATDILPMKLLVDVGNGDRCEEVSKSVPMQFKSANTEENHVLQKFLRRWRYFDYGDESFHLEGRAAKSSAKKRRKPCFICADVRHTGNRCRKLRTCFVCKERGHIAEGCPKSSQEFNICLRCGEPGHDLFSCSNDYSPHDLKGVEFHVHH